MIHKTAIVDSKAKISDNVKIGPYSIIGPEVEIGANSILHSHVNIVGDTKIGNNNQIGPFTYVRESTFTDSNVQLGNFVEVKASNIGKESKSKHLAYIGDVKLENNVNVGAGTVVANFDGKTKHETSIKENTY